MPQNAIPTQNLYSGGSKSVLNITAPAIIKAAPGTVFRVQVVAAGSGSSLIVNDNNALTGNVAGNTILNLPNASAPLGSYALIWPCTTGIVISSVPTGVTLAVSYS